MGDKYFENVSFPSLAESAKHVHVLVFEVVRCARELLCERCLKLLVTQSSSQGGKRFVRFSVVGGLRDLQRVDLHGSHGYR